MEEKIAYLAVNNPTRNQNTKKKFDFVFHYRNIEYNLDRNYRFYVHEDEQIKDLRDKISSYIDTSMKIKLNLAASDKTEKNDENEQNDEKKNKKSKKNTEENKNKVYLPKSKVNFYENGEKMRDKLKFKHFETLTSKVEFKIFDETYKVVINLPQILNLQLPTTLFVGYPVYPSNFETVLVDVQSSKYSWYKSLNKIDWIYITEAYSYTPTKDDLNYYLKLKCLPKFEQKNGNEYYADSSEKVTLFPHQDLPFENRHKFTTTKYSGKKIISYNVLSDRYVKNRYQYCEESALNIDYRKQLILKELKGYNADLICLQETDYKVYKNFYREEILKLDYKYFYDSKQGTSEGLSFFYKSQRFTVLQKKSIIIGKEIQKNSYMSTLWRKVKENDCVAKKLITQNTIFQLIALRSKNKSDEILIIGNTHLYYHPDASHIRLLQIAVCDMYIQYQINQIQQKFPNDRISLIFCGDFNSQPDSGVYKFFVNGQVLQNDEDWKKLPGEHVENINLLQTKKIESACGAPKFTNYTEDFKGCLDYIFYETENLNLKQFIPLLTEEELSKYTALPSIIVPSDHIALVADFSWK